MVSLRDHARRYPCCAMPSRATKHVVIGGGTLLALVGLWLGHTVEYARVWGTSGLSAELFGSIHAYMLPLVGVIALFAAAFAGRLWWIWAHLGHRLDSARARCAAVLRGRPFAASTTTPVELTSSLSSRIAVAWPALTVLQVGFYLFQENIEAVAAGAPAPGLSAITGVHALAPLVHAAVSLLLLLTAALLLRLFRRRVEAVRVAERALRHLLARIQRDVPAPLPVTAATPLQLLGTGVWCRPPPLLPAR
jgi:hypothetical protein